MKHDYISVVEDFISPTISIKVMDSTMIQCFELYKRLCSYCVHNKIKLFVCGPLAFILSNPKDFRKN